jgi:hypothetical protein
MKITVLNWNVKGNADLRPGQVALIEKLQPDVLLLQELRPKSFRGLLDKGWSGMLALQFLPDGHRGAAKGSVVRFCCAVLTRGAWRMSAAATNLRAPSPERWLTARLEGRDDHGRFHALDVGSFACPPGVTWFEKKAEQGRQIAEWMVCRSVPVIAGIDRNGPEHEDADGEVELWRHDAPQLLGTHPAHRLADVLLTAHEQDPDLREQARTERPDGPLEVSYTRGNPGQNQTPGRYDVIYASPALHVESVRYLYEEALEAGSDHGLVLATLRTPERLG